MELLTKEWKNSKDAGLLILRVVFGIALIYGHGFSKVAKIFSGAEIQFMDPIGIGANLSFHLASFAEFFCSLFLIVGLFSRIATLILICNFFAIFIFHAFIVGDDFSVLEMRYLYLFTFIALFLTGPGKFSLDFTLFKPKGVVNPKV